MKKWILGAVYGFLASWPAMGADLAVKAVPRTAVPTLGVCTVTQCSGFYFGGHLEGDGTSADIIGSGINGSIFGNGAGLGVHAGYQFWNGSLMFGGEVGGTWDVGNRTIIGDIANVQPWSVDYLAKIGYGLGGLFNSPPTPSQGPVSIIQALNASLITPYALVGGRTRNFGSGFTTGAGAEYAIGGGWNAFAEYLHINYTDRTISMPGMPPVSIGTENVVRAGINAMF